MYEYNYDVIKLIDGLPTSPPFMRVPINGKPPPPVRAYVGP